MLLEVRIRAPCLKPAVNTPVFSRHNACQVLDASAIIDAFLLTDVCVHGSVAVVLQELALAFLKWSKGLGNGSLL